MAAGLTLREDSYQTFVDGLDAAVREFSGKATFDPVIETDGSLESGYATAAVAGLLQRQVWGAGFPPPVFCDTFLGRPPARLQTKPHKTTSRPSLREKVSQ